MVFICEECECEFDEAMHREQRDNICLLCEGHALGVFSDDDEDPDYSTEEEPESEDYVTDTETETESENGVDIAYEPELKDLYKEFQKVGDIAGNEVEIECNGDVCEVRSRWAGIKGLDGRLSP
jgi:hypothetical protein